MIFGFYGRDPRDVRPPSAGVSRVSVAITNLSFRRAVAWAGALNLAYFGIEFAVALAIGSVSLFADSIDFLEDASVNLLIMLALGWSLRQRSRLGMALAGILLLPGLATLWMAWQKFLHPLPPAPALLSITAAGAMLVNAGCAILLARHRAHGGSLAKAAYLSARNDVLANIAIILAGLVTAYLWASAWPDLLVGLGIAAMNADAAREVWTAAREEHSAAE
jgi:Co/Zn/Cd efflux system component